MLALIGVSSSKVARRPGARPASGEAPWSEAGLERGRTRLRPAAREAGPEARPASSDATRSEGILDQGRLWNEAASGTRPPPAALRIRSRRAGRYLKCAPRGQIARIILPADRDRIAFRCLSTWDSRGKHGAFGGTFPAKAVFRLFRSSHAPTRFGPADGTKISAIVSATDGMPTVAPAAPAGEVRPPNMDRSGIYTFSRYLWRIGDVFGEVRGSATARPEQGRPERVARSDSGLDRGRPVRGSPRERSPRSKDATPRLYKRKADLAALPRGRRPRARWPRARRLGTRPASNEVASSEVASSEVASSEVI